MALVLHFWQSEGMRRLGSPPQRSINYTYRPGAYGIIRRGSQVLLSREAGPSREIVLPGGGIDPGESPLQALYREVLEETGWSIRVQRRLGAYRQFRYMPEYDLHACKVCSIYECVPGRRLSEPLEVGHQALWLEFDEAIDALANECDGVFLAEYLARLI
jgi:8-oxo-dGTP diphosphatase